MSFPVVCVGDANSGGGLVTLFRPTVWAAGRPLAAFASPVTPHPCCGAPGCEAHCAAVITGGAITVLAEGLPVHRMFDVCTCMDPMVTGALNVLVGGPGLSSPADPGSTGLGTVGFST